MKKSHLFVAFASMFALASCGEEFEIPPEPVKVEAVVCNPKNIELTVGEPSKSVNYFIKGTGEFTSDVKITSENEGIATAKMAEDGSKSFVVSPVSAGDTVIKVKSLADESKTADISVHVNPEKIIEVTPKIYSIESDSNGFELALASAPKAVKVTVKGTENIDKSFTVVADNENVTLDKNEFNQPADLVSETFEDIFTVSASKVGTTNLQITSVADKVYSITVPVRVTEGGVIPDKDDVVFDPIIKTIAPDEAFDITVTSSGKVTYSTDPEDASSIFTYKVTETGVHVLGVGEGTAKLYGMVGDVGAECTITVKAIPTDVRSIYFTNNETLGYEEMYLYAWSDYDEKLAEWPGVKLEDVYQNNFEENCYRYTLDILKYNNFILNNGKSGEDERKTPDSVFPTGDYDNIYFTKEADGTLVCGTATFTPCGPNVKFEAEDISMYEGRTMSIGVASMLGDVQYSVESGSEYITILDHDNSHVEIRGEYAGEAVLKAMIPAHDSYETVSDTITITVLDSTLIKTFYFTNNKSWDSVYFHGWGENGDLDTYPGTKLTNVVKNSLGQDCYTFDINPDDYDGFMFIDKTYGTETVNVSVDALGANNNIYLSEWKDDVKKWDVGYATFEPYVYEVAFNQAGGTVYNNKDLTLSVTANDKVTFSIVSGAECVQIISSTDNSVRLGYVAAGSATIKATCGDVSDTITIEVSSESAPKVDRTIYFSNSYGWENVSVYAFNDQGVKNAEWPGVSVVKCGVNNHDQDLYSFKLDENEYETFIVNNGLAEGASQTENVYFADLGANDNIWATEELDGEGHYKIDSTILVHNITLSTNNVALYEGEAKDVTYVTTDENLITYTYVSGSADIVKVDQYKGGYKLTYVGEGSASIKVSCGAAEEVISVTCTAGEKPTNIETFYLTNNYAWSDVKAYVYGDGGVSPKEWPGDTLTCVGQNDQSQDIYKVEIDTNQYHTIVFNGYDSGKAKTAKTDDIKVSSFTDGNNAVYISGWSDEVNLVASVGYWKLVPSVEFDFVEKTVRVDEFIEVELKTSFCSDVVFSSNTVGVATVDKIDDNHAKVTGISLGDAVISAKVTVNGHDYEDSFIIHVNTHEHHFDASTHYCECGEFDPTYAKITFNINYKTNFGENLFIYWVDSVVQDWDHVNKISMSYVEGSTGDWTVTYVFKKNTSILYKAVMVDGGGKARWEDGSNRSLTVTADETINMSWQA